MHHAPNHTLLDQGTKRTQNQVTQVFANHPHANCARNNTSRVPWSDRSTYSGVFGEFLLAANIRPALELYHSRQLTRQLN